MFAFYKLTHTLFITFMDFLNENNLSYWFLNHKKNMKRA
ncbi:hypothetical protein HORM4_390027 [Vibrio harveyi]|nr:hypothetical protein HORM4_390027 [Vibrio harveyi]